MKRLMAGAAIAAATFGMTSSAHGAFVANGNFERGNLSGWEKQYRPDSSCGYWMAYDEFEPEAPPRGGAFLLPQPPQGMFAAAAVQPECPSRQILSQVVKLKPNRIHRLRFKLAYSSESTVGRGGPGFIAPPSLALGVPNQQMRVDVMKAGAPIASVDREHVLKQVFRTRPGDPGVRPYRTERANLSALAGRKVRLRVAVVVTEAPLVTGVDAVKIKTKRL